jgi:hypothetical protein
MFWLKKNEELDDRALARRKKFCQRFLPDGSGEPPMPGLVGSGLVMGAVCFALCLLTSSPLGLIALFPWILGYPVVAGAAEKIAAKKMPFIEAELQRRKNLAAQPPPAPQAPALVFPMPGLMQHFPSAPAPSPTMKVLTFKRAPAKPQQSPGT